MNNPKIDYFFDSFGLDRKECEIIRIEYSNETVEMKIYKTENISHAKPQIEEMSTMSLCNIINFLADTDFTIGTEEPYYIYNRDTHQRVSSMCISLPVCLLQVQYEDHDDNIRFDYFIESNIRDDFYEV